MNLGNLIMVLEIYYLNSIKPISMCFDHGETVS